MTATMALRPQYTSNYFFSGIDDKRYFTSVAGGGDNGSAAAVAIVGMEPIELKCYSWDDFPVVIQSEYERECDDLERERERQYEEEKKEELSPPSPPPSRRRRARSVFYDGDSSNQETSRSASRKSEVVVNSPIRTSSKNSKGKSLHFAPTIEVKTYSIVLGDHPWCESGLPIELGWDVIHTESIKVTFDSTRRLHSRSYLERKGLLLEVGGYTEEELERLENERLDLDRDDHYYGDPLQFLLSPDQQQQQKQAFPSALSRSKSIKSIDGLLSVITSAREA